LLNKYQVLFTTCKLARVWR